MNSLGRNLLVWFIFTIFILGSSFLEFENSTAGTTVSGIISTDTNWTLEGSPYTVVGNIVVESGATLTIEAGVEVLFEGRYEMFVNGTLRSLGKPNKRVVFMPTGPYWESIHVRGHGHLELRNSTLLGGYTAVKIRSDNNIITGNHFEGKSGIYADGDNNLIESNTFVDSGGAIQLDGLSSINTIRGNRFLGIGGVGLSGDRHLVENNYFEGTGGIVGNATNTTIRENVLLDGLIGIQLTFIGSVGLSENNDIYGNWIERSSMYAIFLECRGCRVWNNTFTGNHLIGASQGIDDNGLSHWNQSYPIGGNYWSNYDGDDQYKGPFQNIPGSDGIGDTPYPIYDTTFDYYPLVNYTPQIPDIAVYEDDIVFDPSSPIEEGESLEINAAVHNIGTENASNVIVRFFDGDPQTGIQIDGDKQITFLPRGGWKEWVKVKWTASGIGSHDICVFADPDDTIREMNESNNQACASIEVLPPSAPSPPTDLSAYLSGSRFENVTLNWKLSPDDSGGRNSVARYDIYRGENYSSNISTYQLHDSVPNGTSEYVDENAGEGDTINYFYCVCAVNAANNSSCSSNQAGKFTRPLLGGPNLISVPLIQSNGSTEMILQTVKYDKAWYYDSSSQEWKWHMTSKGYRRGLLSVNHTMGLWVNVTEISNLTVAGIVPANTSIQLYSGWNLVGFPSLNVTYTVSDLKAEVGSTKVEGFDSLPPYLLRVLGDAVVLQAGYGYWVRVEADANWVVDIA
ncbi:MAG: CARDB domain-containing protein [Thermoplasmata archaeon]